MKLLITGATGCVGHNLVSKLANNSDYQITALGRNRDIGKTLVNANTTFVATDIVDRDKIFQLVKEQDAVIHSAALASPWGKYQDFYAANVVGTQNVVEAALSAKVKHFVHISTPSIYYSGAPRMNVHENDPLPKEGVNHYAQTKMLAENVVDLACTQGLPAITLRPRAIFGPYDTAIIPRITRIAERGWFPLISAGKAIIDITYVENVVDAILLCFQAPPTLIGKKYNITNGEPMMLREILEKVFASLNLSVRFYNIPYKAAYYLASVLEGIYHLPMLSNREPMLTRYSVGILGISQTLNIDAARNELGYSPKISIDDGMHKYASWLKNEK